MTLPANKPMLYIIENAQFFVAGLGDRLADVTLLSGQTAACIHGRFEDGKDVYPEKVPVQPPQKTYKHNNMLLDILTSAGNLVSAVDARIGQVKCFPYKTQTAVSLMIHGGGKIIVSVTPIKTKERGFMVSVATEIGKTRADSAMQLKQGDIIPMDIVIKIINKRLAKP